MTKAIGDQSTSAPNQAQPKKAAEPKFPALAKLPETPEELFTSLALSVKTTVTQSTGKKSAKHDYAVPWVGFESWRDARKRLQHFEKAYAKRTSWTPFNDSTSNDGPMSLNAYPG